MSTMKGKTLLKGHALENEGRAPGTSQSHNGLGQAYCRCGMRSPVLPNTSKRQEWHRQHKQDIRESEQP